MDMLQSLDDVGEAEVPVQIYWLYLTARAMLSDHAMDVGPVCLEIVRSVDKEDDDTLAWRMRQGCILGYWARSRGEKVADQ
jgi:hypothetical protein